MTRQSKLFFTAFIGHTILAKGELDQVAWACKAAFDQGRSGLILIFDDRSGRRIDLELDGSIQDVADRVVWLEAYLANEGNPGGAAPRGRGRPKLGVVAKEVTLLPRHWAWLDAQRGSASAVLRRLVDEARKANQGADKVRKSQDEAWRFMYDMAGDAPSFEEALRALYAGNKARFDKETEPWADDIRDYARMLAADAFGAEEDSSGEGAG